MFHYPEVKYLGIFIKLKRKIKCGGTILILFGEKIKIRRII
jgi:hypothetical protein